MRCSENHFPVPGGVARAISYQLLGAAILFAALHADAVPGCAPAPAGLVSWWRGENSTADAVGGNNGTIAGWGTVTYGPGIVGQAFVFDGTHRDRIDLGNPASLQLQDFTLEAWVKRSSPTVTSYDILGADGSVCGDGGCIIGYGRGGYILAVANDGRLILSRTDIDGVLSAPLLTDLNWHHLAVTKAGSNAVFYVDGVAQATPAYVPHEPYTFDDATCSCSAAIAIGSRGDARGGTFYGMIDEPAVFNRTLSAREIQSIYAAGSAGMCLNHPPRADASATLPLVISANNSNATVVLDGSRSSDPDGDSLHYLWFAAGTADPIASGIVAAVTLPLGTNVLTLSVSDGFATNSQTFTVEVITPEQAAARLVALCQSGAARPQPLIATLSAALAAIDRSNPTAAINQLQAFQNKVRAQVAPLDAALADTFIQAAQNIIDALTGAAKANGKLTLSRAADGTMRLRGAAAPGAVYIIEASTNLLDWEKIRVTTNNGTAAFEFVDPNPFSPHLRFYRVVSP